MTEKNIDIAKEIGTPNAILQKFGLQLAKSIISEKSNYDKFILDFSNLNNATTGFFHASIGNLKKEFNGSFKTTFTIVGIEKNPTWKDKFDDAVDMVSNPDISKEIDKAIAELFA